jgi:hypothetical protein
MRNSILTKGRLVLKIIKLKFEFFVFGIEHQIHLNEDLAEQQRE